MPDNKLYALRTSEGFASVLFTVSGPVVWHDKTPKANERAIIYNRQQMDQVRIVLKKEGIAFKAMPVRQWSSIREKFIKVD